MTIEKIVKGTCNQETREHCKQVPFPFKLVQNNLSVSISIKPAPDHTQTASIPYHSVHFIIYPTANKTFDHVEACSQWPIRGKVQTHKAKESAKPLARHVVYESQYFGQLYNRGFLHGCYIPSMATEDMKWRKCLRCDMQPVDYSWWRCRDMKAPQGNYINILLPINYH